MKKTILTALTVMSFLGLNAAAQERRNPPVHRANANANANQSNTDPRRKDNFAEPNAAVEATVMPSSNAPGAKRNDNNAHPNTSATEIYRIGTGDVLDIRLTNFQTRQSTLYTVNDEGKIEYPFVSEPFVVAGLTADEIAAKLNAQIRVFTDPRTQVAVRDYGSHRITIAGAVEPAGAHFLQREAVPLFVVLTALQPAPGAASLTLKRANAPDREIVLNDQAALTTLIVPGDELQFNQPAATPTATTAAPVEKQFFYVIGAVKNPGQRDYFRNMTLTQAVFTAGGLTPKAVGKVIVWRQTADGKLARTDYDLQAIYNGKLADPALDAGDRLEILEK